MNLSQPIRIRKKYTRYTDGMVHPMVKGEICWKQNKEPITLLLDSGAYYTILSKKYLSLLGVDLMDLTKIFSRPIQGAFGKPQLVDFFKMKLIIEGHEIEIPIGFIDTSWNLLGRHPAFLIFSPVVFVEHEERFVLEYKQLSNGRKNEF